MSKYVVEVYSAPYGSRTCLTDLPELLRKKESDRLLFGESLTSSFFPRELRSVFDEALIWVVSAPSGSLPMIRF
jgi:hypothetical protein